MPRAVSDIDVHVIHTIAGLGVSAGGPSRTVPALCAAVNAAGLGVTTEIVTAESRSFGAPASTLGVPTSILPAATGPRGYRRLLDGRIAASLASHKAVLLHDHGQWLAINRASAAAARRSTVNRVVSPRGMLTPWALRHHVWRKRLAWWLFARRDLLGATMLHATSQDEADELRRLGLRQPIAVIPNGVHERQTRSPAGRKSRRVVFLSRLHPVKGVRELVDAWRSVRPRGWNLVLAGPDEAGMLPGLRIAPEDTIDYVGEVEGDRKWALLEDASVVVLPSHSENFGVVVAEALMVGTPVIATHGTPWAGLAEERCGWWIPMTIESLAGAIRDATNMDSSILVNMGRRGHDWVERTFAWPAIGRAMSDVYLWLAGQRPQPACVQPE